MATTENTDPGRIRSARERVWGIRMRMPTDDPLRAVLGDDWHTERWYATEAEREAALLDLPREHEYSRLGDRPSLIYERVERDKPPSPERAGR